MDLLIAFGIALGLLALLKGGVELARGRRRQRAASLPEGEAAVRRAERVPTRIFVDQTLPGGLKAGGINRDPATLLLSGQRFLVSTGFGRVVEIGPDRAGEAKCVGPRRLVIEGSHPSGRARLRVECLVDDAEGWAAAVSAL